VLSALLTSTIAIGCKGKLDLASSSPGTDGGTIDAAPFEPVSARIYVAKVKNLMLGLPATEDEIAAVEQDPTALRGLVDAWFVRPEAQAKFGTFFSKAFQQTQIGPADFFDQIMVDPLPNLPLFTQLQESMSRTALKTIAACRTRRRTAPVIARTTRPWPTPIITVLITKTAPGTQPGRPRVSTK